MARPRRAFSSWPAETREHGADRRTTSLAALALLLGLVVLGLILVHVLRREGQVEDCLMQNRIDCDQMAETPP